MSHLDAHAFWIDTNFELKHRILAVRHFGIERHASENIANAVKAIFSEYNIDPSKVTATTDHGANMVAAFNALHDTGRLVWLIVCLRYLFFVNVDPSMQCQT